MLLNKNAVFCEVYIKIKIAPFYIKKNMVRYKR